MSRHALPLFAFLAACGGPTPASLCEDTAEALEHCLEVNDYSSYTVIQDADECEASFDACSDADLDLVDDYIGCYRDACDLSCLDILDEVDPACLTVYSYATT